MARATIRSSIDVGEVFRDDVAIGIPGVDAVGELHANRPSLWGVRNGWGPQSDCYPPLASERRKTLEGEFPLRRISPDKSFSTTCLTIFPIRSATV